MGDTVILYQVADFKGGKPVIKGRRYQKIGMSRFGGYTDIVFRKLTPERGWPTTISDTDIHYHHTMLGFTPEQAYAQANPTL